MNESPSPLPSAPDLPQPRQGLSVTSLVLGILSVVGCTLFTAIPAIITGHMAHGRAKREPHLYGGRQMALVGLILGYIGIALIPVIAFLAALFLPALAKAKQRAQTIQCVNNMKQLGLAARTWAINNNNLLPPDFVSMSNELATPKLLVCPQDKLKTRVEKWEKFSASENLSYEFLTPGAQEDEVTAKYIFLCPIHGNVTLGDGSVQQRAMRR